MTVSRLIPIGLAGVAVLAFVFLVGFAVYMVAMMIRDGWLAAWGNSPPGRARRTLPGVWPPPPEPGYLCRGQEYPRIPYGQETGVLGAGTSPCPECDTTAGYLHGRGCIVEQCPVCGGSVAACECEYERLAYPDVLSAPVAPATYQPQATRWNMTVSAAASLLAALFCAKHDRLLFYSLLTLTLLNAMSAISLWVKRFQSLRSSSREEALPRDTK